MTPIRSALVWAAVMLLVALANRWLLIADKDAFAMFTIIPALWVATSGKGRDRCTRTDIAA